MKILAALLVTAITLCSNCNTMTVHKTVNHEMYSVCNIEEKDFSEPSEMLDVPYTPCHEFSTDEKYDTTIYQNVVVSAPWQLENKNVTFLAWCDRYVPTSSWTFSTITASTYLETEGKIMEILDAFKLEVFHYAYEYDSNQGKFIESGDFYFDDYYAIEDQFTDNLNEYHLNLSIYDLNHDIVEIVNVTIPIVYDAK